jgi:WD40 repeat protein
VLACNAIFIVSGSQDNSIKIWNASTVELQSTWRGHSDDVRSVSFSPDGKFIASGSFDKTIKIWDAKSGGLEKQINCVAFSPDGSLIAAGDGVEACGSGEVRIYNASTGDPVGSPLMGHKVRPIPLHRMTSLVY